MAKTIVLLALVALLALVTGIACGGERMTVREYAQAHAESGEEYVDYVDYIEGADESLLSGEGIEEFKAFLGKLKKLHPPEELELYHNLTVAVMEKSIEVMELYLEHPFADLAERMQEMEEEELEQVFQTREQEFEEWEQELLELSDQLEELNRELDKARAGLSLQTREILME